MKVKPDPRLFWFLREDILLDLSEPSIQDMYVQQILDHGRAEDVRELLRTIGRETFKEVFGRVRFFIKKDVRRFWEDVVSRY